MFSDVKKKKMQQNEKELKKIHGTVTLKCTNENCHNKLKVTHEESKRVFQCSKCRAGFLKKAKS